MDSFLSTSLLAVLWLIFHAAFIHVWIVSLYQCALYCCGLSWDVTFPFKCWHYSSLALPGFHIDPFRDPGFHCPLSRAACPAPSGEVTRMQTSARLYQSKWGSEGCLPQCQVKERSYSRTTWRKWKTCSRSLWLHAKRGLLKVWRDGFLDKSQSKVSARAWRGT